MQHFNGQIQRRWKSSDFVIYTIDAISYIPFVKEIVCMVIPEP